MQSLPHTTNSSHVSASALACAEGVLEGLPLVMWFIRRHMRRHRGAGLSVPQFRTLAYLDNMPCATLSSLAEFLGSTLPTASRMVSGLVKKGLVRRTGESKDRRKIALELTRKGASVLSFSRKQTQRQVAEMLESLSEPDKRSVARSMALLKTCFECGCEESPPGKNRGK